MFGKNKKNKIQSEDGFDGKRGTAGPGLDSEVDQRIHAMPQRFYVAGKTHRSSLPLLVGIGVLLLGGLGVVAFVLYQQAPVTNPQAVGPDTTPVATAPTNTVPVENQNLNLNENLNTNETVATSTNFNLNTNSANSTTTTQIPVAPEEDEPLPSAPDVDGDSLTLAEEILYGTDPNNSDSDGDGYGDGAELLNGFDPTRPRLTLTESNLFRTYRDEGYEVFYPSSWALQPNVEGGDAVLLRSAGDEFFQVLVIENSEQSSVSDWYRVAFPHADPRTTQVRVNGLEGFQDRIGRNYYLADPADVRKIFVLSYNVGTLTQTNYATTFGFVVKNFRLLP